MRLYIQYTVYTEKSSFHIGKPVDCVYNIVILYVNREWSSQKPKQQQKKKKTEENKNRKANIHKNVGWFDLSIDRLIEITYNHPKLYLRFSHSILHSTAENFVWFGNFVSSSYFAQCSYNVLLLLLFESVCDFWMIVEGAIRPLLNKFFFAWMRFSQLLSLKNFVFFFYFLLIWILNLGESSISKNRCFFFICYTSFYLFFSSISIDWYVKRSMLNCRKIMKIKIGFLLLSSHSFSYFKIKNVETKNNIE